MVIQTPTMMAAFSEMSNVTYDLMAMLTNKLHCVAALEQYKRDAEQVGDDEVLLAFASIERHAHEDIAALRGLLASRI